MTNVGETFRQHEVLLTGANGFLGKVVLGLILDRFPEFKHLHLLIRPGRNSSAEERFEGEVLGSPALAGIVEAAARRHGESFLRRKITVWSGDLARPDCGLEPEKMAALAGRIGAIINCAGRVDFFPPLDDSFSANVDGVEHLIALARCASAKLLHVSTCYVCGAADGLVEETEPIPGFYPRRQGRDDPSFRHTEELHHARDLIRQIYESAGANGKPAKVNPATRSKAVAQRLIALGKQRAEHWGWVNTYTYSKSLGEQLIAAEVGLDYAIVRPAIVESALRFPFPGWIEGGRTAAPLVLMALGGMKHWPVRKDAPLEVVPVDLVASAILAVAALLLDGHEGGRQHPRIYQLGTADVNPIHIEPLVALLDAEAQRLGRGRRDRSAVPGFVHRLAQNPSPRPRPPVKFVSAERARTERLRVQKRIDRMQALIAGMRKVLENAKLPGDRALAGWTAALRTLGLQAAFREQTIDQYLPFVLHNRYIFESENIRRAYALIREADRKLLPWDPERIDWERYWLENQVQGIERWVQPQAVRDWSFRI
ncbi:MAG TPA: SDR family oxidoreductase [Terriglobia bacterium]|nr:SDR family oxidoreductase [Terriglobia bacterium]